MRGPQKAAALLLLVLLLYATDAVVKAQQDIHCATFRLTRDSKSDGEPLLSERIESDPSGSSTRTVTQVYIPWKVVPAEIIDDHPSVERILAREETLLSIQLAKLEWDGVQKRSEKCHKSDLTLAQWSENSFTKTFAALPIPCNLQHGQEYGLDYQSSNFWGSKPRDARNGEAYAPVGGDESMDSILEHASGSRFLPLLFHSQSAAHYPLRAVTVRSCVMIKNITNVIQEIQANLGGGEKEVSVKSDEFVSERQTNKGAGQVWPVRECLVLEANGMCTATFGYVSTGDSSRVLTRNGGANFLEPKSVAQYSTDKLPESFAPGVHNNVFRLTWLCKGKYPTDGWTDLRWNLGGMAATFTKNVRKCADERRVSRSLLALDDVEAPLPCGGRKDKCARCAAAEINADKDFAEFPLLTGVGRITDLTITDSFVTLPRRCQPGSPTYLTLIIEWRAATDATTVRRPFYRETVTMMCPEEEETPSLAFGFGPLAPTTWPVGAYPTRGEYYRPRTAWNLDKFSKARYLYLSVEQDEEVKVSEIDATIRICTDEQAPAYVIKRDTLSASYRTVSGTLRDFNDTHIDFENVPISADKGIVKSVLGSDGKPVYNPNNTNPTVLGGASSFFQWYHNVPGVNYPLEHSINLTLTNAGLYRYDNSSFYPLDNRGFGNQGREHNYHFTDELHFCVTYEPNKVWKFSADDDLFVFLEDKLIVDLGGVKQADSAQLNTSTLNGFVAGNNYRLSIFFAERHYSQSMLTFEVSGYTPKYGDCCDFSCPPPLPEITPVLECTHNYGNGTCESYFGYENHGNTSVELAPYPEINYFHPSPIDRGQPHVFLPARQYKVFSVRWACANASSSLSWTIDGTATASAASSNCPVGCDLVPFSTKLEDSCGVCGGDGTYCGDNHEWCDGDNGKRVHIVFDFDPLGRDLPVCSEIDWEFKNWNVTIDGDDSPPRLINSSTLSGDYGTPNEDFNGTGEGSAGGLYEPGKNARPLGLILVDGDCGRDMCMEPSRKRHDNDDDDDDSKHWDYENDNDPKCGKVSKVKICHVPRGKPQEQHTIYVSKEAVKSHLSHGDYLGKCVPKTTKPTTAPPKTTKPVATTPVPTTVKPGNTTMPPTSTTPAPTTTAPPDTTTPPPVDQCAEGNCIDFNFDRPVFFESIGFLNVEQNEQGGAHVEFYDFEEDLIISVPIADYLFPNGYALMSVNITGVKHMRVCFWRHGAITELNYVYPGSGKVLDKCGVCGGYDSSCRQCIPTLDLELRAEDNITIIPLGPVGPEYQQLFEFCYTTIVGTEQSNVTVAAGFSPYRPCDSQGSLSPCDSPRYVILNDSASKTITNGSWSLSWDSNGRVARVCANFTIHELLECTTAPPDSEAVLAQVVDSTHDAEYTGSFHTFVVAPAAGCESLLRHSDDGFRVTVDASGSASVQYMSAQVDIEAEIGGLWWLPSGQVRILLVTHIRHLEQTTAKRAVEYITTKLVNGALILSELTGVPFDIDAGTDCLANTTDYNLRCTQHWILETDTVPTVNDYSGLKPYSFTVRVRGRDRIPAHINLHLSLKRFTRIEELHDGLSASLLIYRDRYFSDPYFYEPDQVLDCEQSYGLLSLDVPYDWMNHFCATLDFVQLCTADGSLLPFDPSNPEATGCNTPGAASSVKHITLFNRAANYTNSMYGFELLRDPPANCSGKAAFTWMNRHLANDMVFVQVKWHAESTDLRQQSGKKRAAPVEWFNTSSAGQSGCAIGNVCPPSTHVYWQGSCRPRDSPKSDITIWVFNKNSNGSSTADALALVLFLLILLVLIAIAIILLCCVCGTGVAFSLRGGRPSRIVVTQTQSQGPTTADLEASQPLTSSTKHRKKGGAKRSSQDSAPIFLSHKLVL